MNLESCHEYCREIIVAKIIGSVVGRVCVDLTCFSRALESDLATEAVMQVSRCRQNGARNVSMARHPSAVTTSGKYS